MSAPHNLDLDIRSLQVTWGKWCEDYTRVREERDRAVRFLYELSEAAHRHMVPAPLAAIDAFLASLKPPA